MVIFSAVTGGLYLLQKLYQVEMLSIILLFVCP